MSKILAIRRQAASVALLGALSFTSHIGISAQNPGETAGEAATAPSQGLPQVAVPGWFPNTLQQAERMSRGLGKPAAVAAAANDYVVDTTDDTVDAAPGDGACADAAGNCSLRAAVMEANAHAGFESIRLLPRTYALAIAGTSEDGAATGDLDITSADGVNIMGAARAVDTVIDGSDLDRIFHLLPGAQASLSNLTITNGTSALGGGLLNQGGSLDGFNLHILANNSSNIGGGLAANGAAYTELDNSAVTGNASTTTSGGIDNVESTMLLTNVTVSGNASGAGFNSGGIGHSSSASHYTYVIHGTIVNNSAGLRGGGIRVLDGPVYLQNTILGNNTAPDLGPQCFTSVDSAYVVSLGYTHIQGTTDCQYFGSNTDLTTAPQVGPLAENGGKTPTHALPPNSTHREGIAAESCATRTDQRGVRRPQDANNNGLYTCDVGAYEHVGPFVLLQPVPGEVLDYPSGTFMWSAHPTATRYQVDLRGVGFNFSSNRNGSRAQLCAGSVCSASISLSEVRNLSSLEWRVRAIYPGGRASTVWQPFLLAVPGIPTPTFPTDFANLLPANFGGLQWTATPMATRVTLEVFDDFTGARVFLGSYAATTTPRLDEICGATTCAVSSASLGLEADAGRAFSWRVSARRPIGTKVYVTRSATSHFAFVAPSAAPGDPQARRAAD